MKIMKRIFDLVFSLLALLIFSFPMILISLGISLSDRQSPFFKQQRIGLFKKKFVILKFRTFKDGSPSKYGLYLRKTGMDEIPQFLNVLKGEMSIIGPRPLTAIDIERLGWGSDYYLARWKVKPGISGPAQLYGGQNKKTSWFWDKKYSECNNLLIDFLIIVISFLMNIFGKKRIRKIIWPRRDLK